MRDYKPHKRISRTNNFPSVRRTAGINWIDNRPQTLAQAHLSDVIQRQIKVEGTTYSIERHSGREFRRNLMLALQKFKYKDTGTKAMWELVDKDLGKSEVIEYDDWEAFTSALWDKGVLTRTIRGSIMGPKNMGARPAFTTSVQSDLPVGLGEHRRHIISSSTLGKAIEKGYEDLKAVGGDTLGALNTWITAQGHTAQTTEYAALRTIWTITHNNLGNLWVGDGAWNSSIGFIRGSFQQLLSDPALQGFGTVPVKDLVNEILKIKPPMPALAQSWNEIIQTLVEAIRMSDPVLSFLSLAGAFINWSEEIKGIEGDGYNDQPFRVYTALDKLMPSSGYISMNSVLAELDKLPSRSFMYGKEYFPIYRKWIIQFAMSSEDIGKYKAKSLIQEWLLNCDLDYPQDPKTDGYYDKLTAIYYKLLNADKSIFASDGALAHYMALDWKP